MQASVSERFFAVGEIFDFSRGSQKDFSGGSKSGEISFYPFETKKTTSFAITLIGKCQISKSSWSLGPYLPFSTTMNAGSQQWFVFWYVFQLTIDHGACVESNKICTGKRKNRLTPLIKMSAQNSCDGFWHGVTFTSNEAFSSASKASLSTSVLDSFSNDDNSFLSFPFSFLRSSRSAFSASKTAAKYSTSMQSSRHRYPLLTRLKTPLPIAYKTRRKICRLYVIYNLRSESNLLLIKRVWCDVHLTLLTNASVRSSWWVGLTPSRGIYSLGGKAQICYDLKAKYYYLNFAIRQKIFAKSESLLKMSVISAAVNQKEFHLEIV